MPVRRLTKLPRRLTKLNHCNHCPRSHRSAWRLQRGTSAAKTVGNSMRTSSIRRMRVRKRSLIRPTALAERCGRVWACVGVVVGVRVCTCVCVCVWVCFGVWVWAWVCACVFFSVYERIFLLKREWCASHRVAQEPIWMSRRCKRPYKHHPQLLAP